MTTPAPSSPSRRQFLHDSAVIGAAGLLAPNLLSAQSRPAPSSRKIRMAVVGGGFGTSFQWHEHPNCIVEAVSDLIPERRAKLKQVYKCDKTYDSLEQLILDRNVEAVGVFTGAPDHVRHAVACLKAGKHVISAVPACMTLEEAEVLLATVKNTGLSYMMAETSWYHPTVILARQWFREGRFGEIFSTEAEYHHSGLEELFFDAKRQRTWRYGFPPMHYPTHCTGYLVGVTGERLTRVSCTGWGDDSKFLKNNAYKNPFWNETAFFVTDQGHNFRVAVYWNTPTGGTERGQWIGSKLSLFDPHPNGVKATVGELTPAQEKDDGGFIRAKVALRQPPIPEYWKTDLLPEALRHPSGHANSHTFLTHEFIDALVTNRRPAVNIHEALALTVPGIVAHQSALKGGEQLKIPQFG